MNIKYVVMRNLKAIEKSKSDAIGNLKYLNNALKREMVNKQNQNKNLIQSLERQIIEIGQEIKTLNWVLEL